MTEKRLTVWQILKPMDFEDGWYSLAWEPLKHCDQNEGTYNLYSSRCYKFDLGFRAYRSDWTNGWGRYKKAFYFEVFLIWRSFHFWIAWDHKAMPDVVKNGPQG